MSALARVPNDVAPRAARAKARVRLVELIGREVTLKKSGREHSGLCPFHVEKTPSFTVREDKGFFKCFGCGASGDHIGWLMKRRGLGFMAALGELEKVAFGGAVAPASSARELLRLDAARAERERAEMSEAADKLLAADRLWREARAMAKGDAAWRYLEGRGIAMTEITPRLAPDALRFHSGLRHPETAKMYPAMIARVVDVRGAFVGVHRTYLAASAPGAWGKAKVAHPKLTLGAVKGGAIRLFAESETLGVAEGIEDALSAHVLSGLPVWACVDAGKLAAVQLPFGVAHVTIFADRDKPQSEPGKVRAPEGVGVKRARELAARLQGEARRVRIVVPASGAKDFNDELVAKRNGAPS